ncbi:MAG: 4Fe-4S cluster-binding domain-containing protein, partial [Clostridia bacterium]|nr:4Fe-4S cluster-binding domain-containing protein [Clostridia bacterium]
MIINGFQKMTLLDFPEKVACTVFLGGCNFRCPFCHNAGLVLGNNPESYTEEEILSYLEKRKGLLDGVCITG